MLHGALHSGHNTLSESGLGLVIEDIDNKDRRNGLRARQFRTRKRSVMVVQVTARLIDRRGNLHIRIGGLFDGVVVTMLRCKRLTTLILLRLLARYLVINTLFGRSNVKVRVGQTCYRQTMIRLPALARRL